MTCLLRTARWTAAARARESDRADHLFSDPFARAMAKPDGFDLLAEMEPLLISGGRPGAENPYLAIRTRFFDDFLTRAVVKDGAHQIVILAAGFDTRAFRVDWPVGTKLFEIDQDETIVEKETILLDFCVQPRCDRYVIGADLTTDWESSLGQIGFDPDASSAWTIEGLLAYLDENTARRLMAKISVLAAPDSQLCVDVPGRSFFESPRSKPYLAALASNGIPWRFGTDEPEAFFDDYGWDTSVWRAGDEGANFGRWPYPVLPRGYSGLPSSFFVTGVRRNRQPR